MNAPHVTNERYIESPEIMLQERDILMTKDGTIGKIVYVNSLENKATVASHIHVIRTESPIVNPIYLLYYFRTDTFKRLIETKISGSVVPSLLQRDINSMIIVLPTKEIAEKFDSIVGLLEEKIDANIKSTIILEKTWNLLLPKLMSGKIRVPIDNDTLEVT